ncbi:MAG: hypothetical protein AAF547_22895 [Actinomycetota bacterium]
MTDTPRWFDGDDRLLEELRVALTTEDQTGANRAPQPPPVDMLMAGYDIVMADTVEAALTNDSAVDQVAAVRSDLAGARLLSFEADGLTVDVELDGGRIVGHIDPPRPGTVHLDQPTAATPTDPVEPDDLGGFEFELASSGSFRLRFVDDAGAATATAWVDGPHETLG